MYTVDAAESHGKTCVIRFWYLSSDCHCFWRIKFCQLSWFWCKIENKCDNFPTVECEDLHELHYVTSIQSKVNFLWKTLWEKFTQLHTWPGIYPNKRSWTQPIACLSVPDIWLMTVWPLQRRKTADEKSESLQAQPAPTATCVLTCKILPPYVSSYIPLPPSPAPGPFVQTR